LDYNRPAVYQSGLQFFGTISASASHEIKNTLAVISESAGLMQDLLLAAEHGRALDESRLKKSIERIQANVVRGDGIVKNMNAFVHSVDRIFRQTDVVMVVDLIAALVKRLLDMQGISLKTETPTGPAVVVTAPFFLKNLIWLLIDFAIARVAASKILCLVVEKRGDCIEIDLSGLESFDELPSDCLPTEPMQFLVDMLESELEIDADGGRLMLRLRSVSRVD